jgi:hypothetical protein
VNRHTHDERLTEPQRDAVDASYDALRSRGAGSGDSGGVGAAGAVMVPLIIVGSFVVFMLYACFYPVAALVALATGFIVSRVFDMLVPGVGWIAHFLIMLPLAFSALMLFRQRVEWRLEQKRGYLLGRHVLRLVFTAVIAGLSISFILGQEQRSEDQPLDGYSWLHFALVVAAVVLVHFVGRWQDRRLVVESSSAPAWTPEPSSTGRSRTQIPGMALMPAPLRRGLPVMTVVGGAFGAFLGYAGFETATSTLVGLFTGCVGGALLMFVCWLITRPVGALFDRVPLLWPLLMGGIIGVVVSLRLAQADKGSLSTYLVPGIIGGALVFAVPYLLYSAVRRSLPNA